MLWDQYTRLGIHTTTQTQIPGAISAFFITPVSQTPGSTMVFSKVLKVLQFVCWNRGRSDTVGHTLVRPRCKHTRHRMLHIHAVP